MTYSRQRALRACSIAMLIAAAGLAAPHAARAAEAAVTADAGPDAPEVNQIVVTATASKATQVAPVRSSLNATEPEAVITRKYMEETAPRIGDFSTVAAFAPGMIATPQPNGPGLADGGKIQLRGFGDGSYTITYDGVPWGDTNGPSHHGTAFFPNSTIGGVIIERGPGKAEDMGPANFGGSVNLISLPLEEGKSLTQVVTGASFNTEQYITTVQSGDLGGARFLANFQELSSDGYLTFNKTWGNSQMFKGAVPITGTGLTLSALYTHTTYLYNKSDVGDADVYQLKAYGNNFSLSNDPTNQTYYKYNWARKQTNYEYIKLAGDIGHGFGIDNTVYSYGYDNDTSSTDNNLAGPGPYNWTATPGSKTPVVGSTTGPVTVMPGYTKKNEYVVTGDIGKVYYNSPFGKLTAGVWYERADTYRYNINLNLINNAPDYIDSWYPTGLPASKTATNINFIEFSGWKQYQPFAQFEWKPIDGLTVTPGVKYVNWDLYITSPIEKISKPGDTPLSIERIYTRTLPFLTANYRITNTWSAYAQYAQGILVPNISNLYVANNAGTSFLPQLSTNYQLGTVFNRGNLALDGDVYYIQFDHKIQSFTDVTSGQTYDTNSGGAVYRGAEVQANYALPYGLSVFGNYAYISAVGANDPTNPLSNGHQLTGVPLWTSAAGVRFEREHLFRSDDTVVVSLISKFVGSQYNTAASCSNVVSNASGTAYCAANSTLTPVTGLLPAYNQFDLSMTYRVGPYSIEGQVLNLLNTHSLVTMKGKNLLANGQFDLNDATINGSPNTNAPEYQVPTNFQITVRAKFQ
ncbi:MAG TPA: TonB-dependent receptor [Caulobacteraceae bacterium]|nr:TonB-dependent receptor [Caulobacteraceae bacterium]